MCERVAVHLASQGQISRQFCPIDINMSAVRFFLTGSVYIAKALADS